MGVPQNSGPAWVDPSVTGALGSNSAHSTSGFASAHGALYFFALNRDTGGSNINGCSFYKSTDNGDTWAQLDSANTPLTDVGEVRYDAAGDRFLCALVLQTNPSSQQSVFLQHFNLNGGVSESWGAPFAPSGPAAEDVVYAVFIRPDTSVVALYDLGSGNQGSGTRLNASVWNGASWGSPIDVGVGILPFQASGNIIDATAGMDPLTGDMFVGFNDATSTDWGVQTLKADNTLGQFNHFTKVGLGASGNGFRNLVVFHDSIYLVYPSNSFTNNTVSIGTPLSAPIYTQVTPSALSPGIGNVNRSSMLAADSTTLYWAVSFFDVDSNVAYQLFTSADFGQTWAAAPGNDTANYFYYLKTGASPLADGADPLFGSNDCAFCLTSSAGVTTLYGFGNVHNDNAGFFQTYLMNSQAFGSSSPLTISGNPPNGRVGTPYGFCFTTTGGSGGGYVYSITSGSVPPGTSLDPSTGCITGTPTTAGTFTFTVKVTDSDLNTASITRSITIVSGSLIIQLIGWKLYPVANCDTDPREVPDLPDVEIAR